MQIENEQLRNEMETLDHLLNKYGHHALAAIAAKIAKSLNTSKPDYKRLASVDMWGGSGALWEVDLISSKISEEAYADKKSFRESIIRIATVMEGLGIANERSKWIARVFQVWLEKGF